MTAVSAVHEDVHERARENQEEGQVAKSVGEVLRPQQDAGDDQEGRAHQECSRRPETALGLGALMMLRMMVVYGHVALLYSTTSRPRNMPIGQANAILAGLLRQQLDGDGLARRQLGALVEVGEDHLVRARGGLLAAEVEADGLAAPDDDDVGRVAALHQDHRLLVAA